MTIIANCLIALNFLMFPIKNVLSMFTNINYVGNVIMVNIFPEICPRMTFGFYIGIKLLIGNMCAT